MSVNVNVVGTRAGMLKQKGVFLVNLLLQSELSAARDEDACLLKCLPTLYLPTFDL